MQPRPKTFARRRIATVWREGWAAGVNGKACDECPYPLSNVGPLLEWSCACSDAGWMLLLRKQNNDAAKQ